jgi:hypothetical protein
MRGGGIGSAVQAVNGAPFFIPPARSGFVSACDKADSRDPVTDLSKEKSARATSIRDPTPGQMRLATSQPEIAYLNLVDVVSGLTFGTTENHLPPWLNALCRSSVIEAC